MTRESSGCRYPVLQLRTLPEDCVGSVLAQPIDVRVLVIDDASTDDSAIVGEALARADSRVTFRRHERNIGHIPTYNEGLIGWASSDYSLLLSADDVVAPGALARAAHVLDRHPDAGLAYGMGVLFTTDAPRIGPDPRSATLSTVDSGMTFVQHCFEQTIFSKPEQPVVRQPRRGSRSSEDIARSCRTPATSKCGCVSPSRARRRPSLRAGLHVRGHGHNMRVRLYREPAARLPARSSPPATRLCASGRPGARYRRVAPQRWARASAWTPAGSRSARSRTPISYHQ